MRGLDGSGVEVYGHVQDDGTVRAYRSCADAEAAGPVESLVVHSADNGGEWVYPATGRTFHPEDVVNRLSPARATVDVRDVLAGLSLPPGVQSVVSHDTQAGGAVQTQIIVTHQLGGPRWWPLIEEALWRLPNVVSVAIQDNQIGYNYRFIHVVRRWHNA